MLLRGLGMGLLAIYMLILAIGFAYLLSSHVPAVSRVVCKLCCRRRGDELNCALIEL